MMDSVDVVIVGAGPSGSSAAYFLATRGVDVALVDKSTFPREKTCGDGLGPRSIHMLYKMGLGEWLASGGYHRCDRSRLFSSSGDYFEAAIPAEDTRFPHFYIVSRHDLDQKLVEKAQAAGARVYQGYKALEPVVSGGTVRAVRVDSGTQQEIPCKVIVCADGTHGTFAMRTGVTCVKPHAVAVRAYYSGVKGLDDCINVFVDERIGEGYAWVFPTSKETANIGLGISTRMLKRDNLSLRELLAWFVTEKDTGPIDLSGARPITDIKGAHLRMGYGRHSVVADGIVLTGDAAGLINPLSGEGIAYALESGELAAEAIKEALDKGDVTAKGLALYKDKLDRRFLMDHRVYEFLRDSLAKPKRMERAVKKAQNNPYFAGKFVSIMLSTERALSAFSPRMLACYLRP